MSRCQRECRRFEPDYLLQFLTQEFKMKVTLEIRAAEGGEDSKLFVKDLAQAYSRMFTRVG